MLLAGVVELFAEGEAHAAAGRFDAATTTVRKAVFLTPEDPMPHARLGFALRDAVTGFCALPQRQRLLRGAH